MTTGALLEEITQVFASKGLVAHRREALRLLADITGAPAGTPLSHPEQRLAPDQVARARQAAARRADGVPLAYATGVAAFRFLTLSVDPRVLIPRPETEGLVEHVLTWQASRAPGGTAVDVCTGSGCIALSLAQEGAFAGIVGTDRSHDALAVARRNHAQVRPATPVQWMVGDLLAALAGRRVEVVVANPPYVTAAEWEGLEPGVRDHEPREALVAGDAGMALIARLTAEAYPLLRAGGLLAVEVDSRRADLARRVAVAAGFGTARIEDDVFGRSRYLLAIKEQS